MFSVQSLLGWLDMYRGSIRVTSTKSDQKLTCEFNSRNTPAGLLEFIWDAICVNFFAAVRTRHIQTDSNTGGWRTDLGVGQDMVHQFY